MTSFRKTQDGYTKVNPENDSSGMSAKSNFSVTSPPKTVSI